ncbi:MAG: transcriptional regulator NrdR [Lachnospirales bacterium]
MKCPFCGNNETKVINSRSANEEVDIRRRRCCDVCNRRFTTIERVEMIEILIIKRDNTREAYSRKKIYNSVLNACNKRSIKSEEIEILVNKVENNLYALGVQEVTSFDIGVFVMEELKLLDEVAYVRFASVCKQFEDIEVFLEELQKLIMERKDK